MTNVDDRKAEDMSVDEIELEKYTLVGVQMSVGWNEAQAARFEYLKHHPSWGRLGPEPGELSDEGSDYTPPPLRSLFRTPDPLPSDPVIVRARTRTRTRDRDRTRTRDRVSAHVPTKVPSDVAPIRVPKKGGICHQFRNNGQCKFGKRCRYAHVAPATPAPSRRGSLCGRGPDPLPVKHEPRPPRKVQRTLEEGKDTELRPPVVATNSVTVSKGVVLCVVVAVVVSFACAVAGTYWLMR